MIFLTLPAYNEEAALPRLLDKAAKLRAELGGGLRVIVVDDGSADGTAAAAKNHPLAAEGALDLVPHGTNKGLAAAMRTGIDAFLARSADPDDIMVTMDADDTHDPSYIPALVERIRGGAGVAVCSRFVAGGVERGVNTFRKGLSRGAKLFMDALAPLPGVKDISCGYRAYSRAALDRARRTYGAHLIQCPGGSVQAELLIRLIETGERVEEIPFTLRYDLKEGPSKLRMSTTIRGYLGLRGIQKRARAEAKLMKEYMDDPPDASGVLVLTCTYNERENIEPLVHRVFESLPGASLLVVDDSSPDGTGAAVEELRSEYPRLHLLSRAGKLGLGSAIIAGFLWGREKGFSAVINMDADFSHDPVSLPAFVKKSAEADYVIGARYVPGGGTLNWGLHRKILSRGGNTFARYLLGIPMVHDLTTGYRLVRTDKLDAIGLPDITAKGYGFLTVMTYQAVRAGLRIAEVPIRFLDRQYGASKMSANIIKEAFWMVLKLRMDRRKK